MSKPIGNTNHHYNLKHFQANVSARIFEIKEKYINESYSGRIPVKRDSNK